MAETVQASQQDGHFNESIVNEDRPHEVPSGYGTAGRV